MIPIANQLLLSLSRQAREHPRKRVMYNFHQTAGDPIQRMINALEPGTYVCPHRHFQPDKREVFILLSGSLAVFEFDSEGMIQEQCILSGSTGNIGIEIPAAHWHTILALEENTLVYEVKDGPYLPMTDKDFAPWAPREGDKNAAAYHQYLWQLIKN